MTYGELNQLQRSALDWIDVKYAVLKRAGKLPHTDKTVSVEEEHETALSRARSAVNYAFSSTTFGTPKFGLLPDHEVSTRGLVKDFHDKLAMMERAATPTAEDILLKLAITRVFEKLNIAMPQTALAR